MIVIIILVSICLLYLWMIHPQNLKDEKWEGFRHYYYAHRGLHDSQSNIPENSMGATLTEQRRVSEDGLRVVKLCCKGRTVDREYLSDGTLPESHG